MNKNRYKIIFSKVKSCLIPVAEYINYQSGDSVNSSEEVEKTADLSNQSQKLFCLSALSCIVKSSYFPHLMSVGNISLALLFVVPNTVFANTKSEDIILDNIETKVTTMQNGVHIIDIAKPQENGISNNKFEKFSVEKGAVFNNSNKDGNSYLVGYLEKNKNFDEKNTAKAILTQVTGSQMSKIQGGLEVFGDKADLLIINPNGINLNGVQTFNTDRFVASTSNVIDPKNGITLSVDKGSISIGESGIATDGLKYLDIVAKKIEQKGAIRNLDSKKPIETDISFIAGSSEYDVNNRTVKFKQGQSTEVVITGIEAGAMYGNHITFITTDTGAGVNHKGIILSEKDIQIENKKGTVEIATLQAKGDIKLKGSHQFNIKEKISAGKEIELNSDKIVLKKKSQVRGKQVDIKANELFTSENTKISGPSITFNTSSLDIGKNSTVIATNLTVKGKSLTNKGKVAARFSTIDVDLLKNESEILAEKSLSIKTFGIDSNNLDFVNGYQNNGIIQSKGEVNLVLKGQSSLSNSNFSTISHKLPEAGEKLSLSANDVFFSSGSENQLLGSFSIYAGQFLNQGILTSGNKLSILSKNEIINKGLLGAKNSLNLTSFNSNITNKESGVLHSDGTMNINANMSIDNLGEIISKGKITVEAQRLVNDVALTGNVTTTTERIKSKIIDPGSSRSDYYEISGTIPKFDSKTLKVSRVGNIRSENDFEFIQKQSLLSGAGIINHGIINVQGNFYSNGTKNIINDMKYVRKGLFSDYLRRHLSLKVTFQPIFNLFGSALDGQTVYNFDTLDDLFKEFFKSDDRYIKTGIYYLDKKEVWKLLKSVKSAEFQSILTSILGPNWEGQEVKVLKERYKEIAGTREIVDKRQLVDFYPTEKAKILAGAFTGNSDILVNGKSGDKGNFDNEISIGKHTLKVPNIQFRPLNEQLDNPNKNELDLSVLLELLSNPNIFIERSLQNKKEDNVSKPENETPNLDNNISKPKNETPKLDNNISKPESDTPNLDDNLSKPEDNSPKNDFIPEDYDKDLLAETEEEKKQRLEAEKQEKEKQRLEQERLQKELEEERKKKEALSEEEKQRLEEYEKKLAEEKKKADELAKLREIPLDKDRARVEIDPLYQTRAKYINQDDYIGSDYFFNRVVPKGEEDKVSVIGDSYFEHQLITRSIEKKVDNHLALKYDLTNVELVKRLMDNAYHSSGDLNLTLGQALTQEQQDNLKEDIIWYVKSTVQGKEVYIPQVYFAKTTLEDAEKYKGLGNAVLKAREINFKAKDVQNSGVIAGKSIDIDAENKISNAGDILGKELVKLKGHKGIESSATSYADEKGNTTVEKSKIVSEGHLHLETDLDSNIDITASKIKGQTGFVKTKDLNVKDTHKFSSEHKSKRIIADLGFGLLPLHYVAGGEKEDTYKAESVGSEVEVGHLHLAVKGDLEQSGSTIEAERLTGVVQGNYTTKTGQNIQHTEKNRSVLAVGGVVSASGGGYSASASMNSVDGATTEIVESDHTGVNAEFGLTFEQESTSRTDLKNVNSQLKVKGGDLHILGTFDLGGLDINKNEQQNRHSSDEETANKSQTGRDEKQNGQENIDKRMLKEDKSDLANSLSSEEKPEETAQADKTEQTGKVEVDPQGSQENAKHAEEMLDKAKNGDLEKPSSSEKQDSRKNEESTVANKLSEEQIEELMSEKDQEFFRAQKQLKNDQLRLTARDIKSTKFKDETDIKSDKFSFKAGLVAEGHSSVADIASRTAKQARDAKNGIKQDGTAALQAGSDIANLITGDLVGGSLKRQVGYTSSSSTINEKSDNRNTLNGNLVLSTTEGGIELNNVQRDKGGKLTLNSKEDVVINAGKTERTEHEESRRLTVSEGNTVSCGLMSQGCAVGVTVGVDGGASKTDTHSVSYQNSQLLGDEIEINTEKDLKLSGANIKADVYKSKVGGKTEIESKQDTYSRHTKRFDIGVSAGASVTTSLSIKPTGSLSVGYGQEDETSRKVGEQSGIEAGRMEGQINDLNLKGGYLVDQSNSGGLNIAGNVTHESLQDYHHKDGGDFGVSVGANERGTSQLNLRGGRVAQKHYEATQHSTLSGVKADKLKEPVNKDLAKSKTVERDDQYASTSFGFEIMDLAELGQKGVDKAKKLRDNNRGNRLADTEPSYNQAQKPKAGQEPIYEEIADNAYGKVGDANADTRRNAPEQEPIYEEIADNAYGKVGDANADTRRNGTESEPIYSEVQKPKAGQEPIYEEIADNAYGKVGDANADTRRNATESDPIYSQAQKPKVTNEQLSKSASQGAEGDYAEIPALSEQGNKAKRALPELPQTGSVKSAQSAEGDYAEIPALSEQSKKVTQENANNNNNNNSGVEGAEANPNSAKSSSPEAGTATEVAKAESAKPSLLDKIKQLFKKDGSKKAAQENANSNNKNNSGEENAQANTKPNYDKLEDNLNLKQLLELESKRYDEFEQKILKNEEFLSESREQAKKNVPESVLKQMAGSPELEEILTDGAKRIERKINEALHFKPTEQEFDSIQQLVKQLPKSEDIKDIPEQTKSIVEALAETSKTIQRSPELKDKLEGAVEEFLNNTRNGLTVESIEKLNHGLRQDEGEDRILYKKESLTKEDAVFSGPQASKLQLAQTIDFINQAKAQGVEPSVLAGMVYQRLIAYHPFAEGNGRMARVIVNKLLLDAGYPPFTKFPSQFEEKIIPQSDSTKESASSSQVIQEFLRILSEKSVDEAKPKSTPVEKAPQSQSSSEDVYSRIDPTKKKVKTESEADKAARIAKEKDESLGKKRSVPSEDNADYMTIKRLKDELSSDNPNQAQQTDQPKAQAPKAKSESDYAEIPALPEQGNKAKRALPELPSAPKAKADSEGDYETITDAKPKAKSESGNDQNALNEKPSAPEVAEKASEEAQRVKPEVEDLYGKVDKSPEALAKAKERTADIPLTKPKAEAEDVAPALPKRPTETVETASKEAKPSAESASAPKKAEKAAKSDSESFLSKVKNFFKGSNSESTAAKKAAKPEAKAEETRAPSYDDLPDNLNLKGLLDLENQRNKEFDNKVLKNPEFLEGAKAEAKKSIPEATIKQMGDSPEFNDILTEGARKVEQRINDAVTFKPSVEEFSNIQNLVKQLPKGSVLESTESMTDSITDALASTSKTIQKNPELKEQIRDAIDEFLTNSRGKDLTVEMIEKLNHGLRPDEGADRLLYKKETLTKENAVFSSPEASKIQLAETIDFINKARQNGVEPSVLAGLVYQRLIAYHPFAEGNGRMARVIVNKILLDNGYPPFTKFDESFEHKIIPQTNKSAESATSSEVVSEFLTELGKKTLPKGSEPIAKSSEKVQKVEDTQPLATPSTSGEKAQKVEDTQPLAIPSTSGEKVQKVEDNQLVVPSTKPKADEPVNKATPIDDKVQSKELVEQPRSLAQQLKDKFQPLRVGKKIKAVRDSAEQFGGEVSFKYAQSKGEVFNEIIKHTETQNGTCEATCAYWISRKVNEDQSLFKEIYPNGKEGKLDKQAFEKIKKLQTEFINSGSSATQQFKFTEDWLNEQGVTPKQKQFGEFSRKDEVTGTVTKSNVKALIEAILDTGADQSGVKKISINLKGGSHTVAASVNGEKVSLFDPNFGEITFKTRKEFADWFKEAFWEKSGYAGNDEAKRFFNIINYNLK